MTVQFRNPQYTDDIENIIILHGRPYYINLELVYDDNGIPMGVKVLDFELNSDRKVNYTKWHAWSVKWGGFPEFVQGEVVPVSEDGRPYQYICTVNNNWGDNGNCNIFILFSGAKFNQKIEDIYLEASCH